MSRSPIDSVPPDQARDYLSAWEQLTGFMRRRLSFSGRERNCCFLNTGGSRFADVSSASGLDLIDDARAVALVDWDHDGDQDLWFLNRTGPQVRFLRNDVPSGHHFVALRLVGDPARGTARDAVGARVELRPGGGARPRIKTLAAGDGFFSQSSRWLHFGLGSATEIERLVVHWPGRGGREAFDGLEVDGRFLIVQGTGRAEPWIPPRRKVSLMPSTPAVRALTGRARTVLLSPSPTLDPDFVDLDGRPARLPAGPVLVNLWASWCAPCVEELRAMGSRGEKLRAAGVTVVALNVEDATATGDFDPADARSFLDALGFGFPAGVASPALLDELQELADRVLYFQDPLPLPTSFLLDAGRQVSVIYKGAVDPTEVAHDAGTLARRPSRLQDMAGSFPGRWVLDRFAHDVRSVADVYLEAGDPQGAIDYLRWTVRADRRAPGPERDRDLAGTHLVLGNVQLAAGRPEDAARAYEQALRLAHDDPLPRLALADLRITQGRDAEASALLEGVLARLPEDPRALTRLGMLRAGAGRLEEAVEYYRRAVEADAGAWTAANNLAWIRATHPDPAMRDGAAAVRLATLACEATGYSNPDVLDTLAASRAEAGDFAAALEVIDRALALLPGETHPSAAPLRAHRELYGSRRAYRDPLFDRE